MQAEGMAPPSGCASRLEKPTTRPGSVALETWRGEWWTQGGGGTAWDGLSYDPQADLLYVGIGNGFPIAQEERSPGGGDNLYLGSILALRPETGALVWYYQAMPGEQWDYTATQNMILAELVVGGRERRVLMQASKNGFFYVLDRLTGELISAEPFARVTWATGIDMRTGRPIETPEARYGTEGSWISPGPRGAHSWPPMSWNPAMGLVYIPGENSAGFYVARATNRDRTARRPDRRRQPPRFDDPPGFLVAWDPVRQEERWRVGFETMHNGGTLSTAGGLVFAADYTGRFAAFHASTGEVTWSYDVGPGPATPVTYQVNGQQFVTVLSDERVWTFALAEGAK